MKKKLMLLIAIMLVLSIGAAIIISLSDKSKRIVATEEGDKLRVMTTFYPVYMIGLNIAEGIDDITIKNLTDLNTGCLHDYQLTTDDMKNISEADILIINGGGMEGFLSDVEANYPGLKIIDTSTGISMLHNGESSEEHAEHQSEHLSEENSDEEEHAHGEFNAHVWLDPELYIKQIENVRDGILSYINVNRPDAVNLEQAIRNNAQAYIDKVASLDNEVKDYAESYASVRTSKSMDSGKAVIFHDSFAYLAGRVGLSVVYSVPLDADTSLSAGEIAEIVQEVKKEDIRYLFTEEQFSDSIARQIAAETGARIYIIDSAVTGDGSKDSYIKAMKKNLATLEDAVEDEP